MRSPDRVVRGRPACLFGCRAGGRGGADNADGEDESEWGSSPISLPSDPPAPTGATTQTRPDRGEPRGLNPSLEAIRQQGKPVGEGRWMQSQPLSPHVPALYDPPPFQPHCRFRQLCSHLHFKPLKTQHFSTFHPFPSLKSLFHPVLNF